MGGSGAGKTKNNRFIALVSTPRDSDLGRVLQIDRLTYTDIPFTKPKFFCFFFELLRAESF